MCEVYKTRHAIQRHLAKYIALVRAQAWRNWRNEGLKFLEGMHWLSTNLCIFMCKVTVVGPVLFSRALRYEGLFFSFGQFSVARVLLILWSTGGHFICFWACDSESWRFLIWRSAWLQGFLLSFHFEDCWGRGRKRGQEQLLRTVESSPGA